MRQRYTVMKAQEEDRILIREEGELDKDLFSTQCTVSFAPDTLRQALGRGVFPAIQLIRSKDLYPSLPVAEKLVEAIRHFLDDGTQPVEVHINDVDFIAKRTKTAAAEPQDADEDAGDLEDLLEDDSDDFDDDFALDDISQSVKVADEDGVDVDDTP